MDRKELFRLVQKGEGQHLEFKLKSNHPDKICKEVIAFANSEGGHLLIGVSDDKQLKGLRFPNEDHYVLQQAFSQYIQPAVDYSEELVSLANGRSVLVYFIPKSEYSPHYYLEGDKKIAFVRSNDQSVKASHEMKAILKERKKDKSYRFSFQEKEKRLLEYLDEHEAITVSEFMKLANVDRKKASRTLVLLSLSNVLSIKPCEKEDIFILNNTLV